MTSSRADAGGSVVAPRTWDANPAACNVGHGSSVRRHRRQHNSGERRGTPTHEVKMGKLPTFVINANVLRDGPDRQHERDNDLGRYAENALQQQMRAPAIPHRVGAAHMAVAIQAKLHERAFAQTQRKGVMLNRRTVLSLALGEARLRRVVNSVAGTAASLASMCSTTAMAGHTPRHTSFPMCLRTQHLRQEYLALAHQSQDRKAAKPAAAPCGRR
jgi:hypothetical protein